MNELRAAFEAFHAYRKPSKGAVKRETMFARLPDDSYVDDSVQRHWWTWQNAAAPSPAAPVVPQWQPIETAPKDRHVLLLVPTRYGKWAKALVLEGEWDFGGLWVIFNADEAIQLVKPTHWQPLPAAPSQSTQTTSDASDQ